MIAEDMKQSIIEELKKIEKEENVKILMAIESGSRAWGFASPDSDYDVRFIYVRKTEDYLRLEGIRDVIEWKLDDVLDINGWDLKKALQLLYKSNPTMFEWCTSPIIYYTSPEFNRIKEILPQYFSEKRSLYHYWHMAESNYREFLKGEEVRIKKYLYVLRPLLAAKWILNKKVAPPMLFDELVEAELEDELREELAKLLVLKKTLPEMGMAPRIQVFNDYIDKMLPKIKEAAENIDGSAVEWNALNELFLELIK